MSSDSSDIFLYDVRNLPTSLRVAFALRQMLEDPGTDLAQIEDLLRAEPVLASALIRAANASSYGSPMMHPSVSEAIQKLGFSAARVLSISLAVQQLQRGIGNASARLMAEELWEFTFEVACLCEAVAVFDRSPTPELSMLHGLTHTLPQFAFLASLNNSRTARFDRSQILDLARRAHLPSLYRILTDLGLEELAHPSEPDQVRIDLAKTATRMRSPFASEHDIPFDATILGPAEWFEQAQRRVDKLKLMINSANAPRY
ncbi:HDOD domain-containing protein [Cognatazoarcus halotolerans]|uniref:HDOD domain-containing protein n=1 Tax=Cognatazoarcus halotolerans TaxID=2686016 RepID=UPI0013590E99|nr:HDOD domain-containing protein [Cognatazoarcus halotolerans]MCB1900584.1 HDOD domain-containing protein [Rhodocyclaceae bacterium]MCP5310565.1 HDOD domain-containing protein [Zoogloeaceae bacterium]